MVPSAGAMFSNSTPQPHSASKQPGRKTTPTPEGQEPGKKPKKANSEIRKQQNRIASRNYREKRKRKLQYLQQLLKDGSSTEEAAQAVEEAEGQHLMSPRYHAHELAAPAMTLPSSSGFSTSSSSTSSNMINPILATTATSYESQFLPTSQTYSTFEPTWDTSMYEPPPPVNISSWSVPAWIPSIDYNTPATNARQQNFQYTPPHSHHSYEQLPTPPQQPRTPDPDLFIVGSYGHCRGRDGQSLGISSVSLPSPSASSPMYHPRYRAAP